MAQDLAHLGRALGAALQGAGKAKADRSLASLAGVSGAWVGQVADLVDVGGLPVMARDGAVEVLPDEVRVDVHLRSRNGAGALVRLRLDRKARSPLPPVLVWAEGQGRPRSNDPSPESLRSLFCGRQPVRVVGLGFIEALRAQAPDVGYRALGDGIVELDMTPTEAGRLPLRRLFEIVHLADVHGATLALPARNAPAAQHLGFKVEGRLCLRRPRIVRPPVWAPLDLPLQADAVAEEAKPSKSRGPREASIEPWPHREGHVGYRALDAAAGTLCRLAVEDAKQLASSLADASTVSRAGGTSPKYAEQLRRVCLQQIQKGWAATFVVPLTRMRGNDLARALANAMPDVSRTSEIGPALERMGLILGELPDPTPLMDHARRAVAYLEACRVVAAGLDEIVDRRIASKAPDIFEPGRPQKGVADRVAAVRERIPALVAHAGLAIDPEAVLAQAERLLAEHPNARLEGFDIDFAAGGSGSIRMDLANGASSLSMQATVGPDEVSIEVLSNEGGRRTPLWFGERTIPGDVAPAFSSA